MGKKQQAYRARSTTANRSTRNLNIKGSTDGMNGNVFECFYEQCNIRQYAKTEGALEGYAKRTLRFHEGSLRPRPRSP